MVVRCCDRAGRGSKNRNGDDGDHDETWHVSLSSMCDLQRSAIGDVPPAQLTHRSGDWIVRSLSQDYAAIELALTPVHPASRQLVARLESPDVLLPVAGGLGVHEAHDLRPMPSICTPDVPRRFPSRRSTGRTVRIMTFVPGITDQDELAADIAGGKLVRSAAAVVESLPGGGGEAAAREQGKGHDDLDLGPVKSETGLQPRSRLRTRERLFSRHSCSYRRMQPRSTSATNDFRNPRSNSMRSTPGSSASLSMEPATFARDHIWTVKTLSVSPLKLHSLRSERRDR
jgi:hypothetical protein